jgi:hypothetical protein
MLQQVRRQMAADAFELEAQAKVNAPWQDDTGNARNGLKGFMESSLDTVRIVLAHSASYGIYLELARGGKYAILWPTIRDYADRWKRR